MPKAKFKPIKAGMMFILAKSEDVMNLSSCCDKE